MLPSILHAIELATLALMVWRLRKFLFPRKVPRTNNGGCVILSVGKKASADGAYADLPEGQDGLVGLQSAQGQYLVVDFASKTLRDPDYDELAHLRRTSAEGQKTVTV